MPRLPEPLNKKGTTVTLHTIQTTAFSRKVESGYALPKRLSRKSILPYPSGFILEPRISEPPVLVGFWQLAGDPWFVGIPRICDFRDSLSKTINLHTIYPAIRKALLP